MNIANLLTSMRIASIPALVVVLLSSFRGKEWVSFFIFIFASLTDMLDGIWARKKNRVTIFGQLFDPVADKLLVTSTLICLVSMEVVSAWMAVVIIGREIAVTGFRAIASSRGFNIPASHWGKAKMVLEIFTLAMLILGERILGKFYFLPRLGLWLVIVVAIFSGVEYYLKYWRFLHSHPS